MPGLPGDAGRAAPPPPAQARKRRPPGWRQGRRPVGRRARRRQEANQGTRRRGCGPEAPLCSGREAQQASSRPAGGTPTTDFSLQLPRAEQAMAPLEPGPARLSHSTTQVRWARPACQDPSRSLSAAGQEPPGKTCRTVRVEYEQGRTTLSRPCGEPPGVNGTHGGVRGETNEIDRLEQRGDDTLPTAVRARARDDDETVEICPQLGCSDKPELRQAGHCAPVPERRGAREQQEQQARQSRRPLCHSGTGPGGAEEPVRCHCRPEQDCAPSREPAPWKQAGQLRDDRQNPLGRQRPRTGARRRAPGSDADSRSDTRRWQRPGKSMRSHGRSIRTYVRQAKSGSW